MTEFHYNPALSQQLRSTANNLENDGLRRTANLIRQGADALDASVVTVKELRQEKSRLALDYLSLDGQATTLMAENDTLRGLLAEVRAAMDETSPGMAHIELIDRVDAALGENDD